MPINRLLRRAKLSSSSRFIQAFSLMLMAFILGRYLRYGFQEFINIPYGLDDFLAFLHRFEQGYHQAESPMDVLRFLFTPDHWPHLKLTSRLVAIAQYEWDGVVSFRNLTLIGMFLAPLHLGSLWWTNRKIPVIWFVPVALLLLVPVVTTFWVVTSLAFPFVFLLGYLCLFEVFEGRPVRSVCVGIFASCSSGVGTFIPFVALPVLILRKERSRRVWICWGIYMAVCMRILLYLYKIRPVKKIVHDGVAEEGMTGLIRWATQIQLASTTLLRSTYELFQQQWDNANPLVPALSILGVILHVLLLALFVWKWKVVVEKAPHLISFLLLLGLSAVLASWIRMNPDQPMYQLPQWRYMYISVLYVITLYLLWLTLCPRVQNTIWLAGVLLLGSILPYQQRWSHIHTWYEAVQRRGGLVMLDAVSNRHGHNDWNHRLMASILFSSAKSGIYQVPEEYLSGTYEIGVLENIPDIERIPLQADKVKLEEEGKYIRIDFRAASPDVTRLVFHQERDEEAWTYEVLKDDVIQRSTHSDECDYRIYLYKPALRRVFGTVHLYFYQPGETPRLLDTGKTLTLP